ncbi:MAG: hypothetical protein E7607_08490 [Ruminococcaceae bacterium]|nr:hypothetical protein [Oscillospiraceae bacterium]
MKKKFTAILLLCSLCLAICACDMNALDEVNQNNSTETYAKNNTEKTEGQDITEESDTIIEIEVELLTIESEAEYTDFLNSNEMPADFVSYDKIEAIGTFYGLVFLSDAYRNDYSSYMYSLIDSNGVEITLYVDHCDETLSTSSSILGVNEMDMRLLSDESSGAYVSDNIEYRYVSGKLLSISWKAQNINYTLCGSMLLSGYPLTESTFVGKLLNTDTALQALETVFGEITK